MSTSADDAVRNRIQPLSMSREVSGPAAAEWGMIYRCVPTPTSFEDRRPPEYQGR